MKYLLDTNICVYFLNKNENIVKKIAMINPEDLAISVFNVAELLYGAYNSQFVQKNLARVQYFEKSVTVLSLGREAIELYAEIKAMLKSNGSLIDDFDLLIGVIALSNDLILVTNNEKHFSRIPNLKIENWVMK